MGRRFQRNIESFVCEKCGLSVQGDGFTNHCPRCLWSKHVDIFPGDREAQCHGMMEPVGVESRSSETILTHLCIVCGYTSRNRMAADDDYEKVLEVAAGRRP